MPFHIWFCVIHVGLKQIDVQTFTLAVTPTANLECTFGVFLKVQLPRFNLWKVYVTCSPLLLHWTTLIVVDNCSPSEPRCSTPVV